MAAQALSACPVRSRPRPDGGVPRRPLDDPALARAAHQLASEVLRGKLGGLRLARVMGGVWVVTAAGFAALGIGGLVGSPHDPRYALALVDCALFTVPTVIIVRRLPQQRRKVGLALELNADGHHRPGDGPGGDTGELD